MYIEKLTLENIRNFKQFTWELGEDEPRAGWHVLLGDNGAGKSTILKATALALLGYRNTAALRISAEDWIPAGAKEGVVILESENSFCGQVIHRLHRDEGPLDSDDASLAFPGFSASFGPFRRFSGGSDEYEKLSSSRPRLSRHLSLFGEDVALTETQEWLKDLHYQKLDAQSRGEAEPQEGLLDKVKAFINQDGLLPNQTRLTEISPKGVIFSDINGARVALDSLSDGFRSVLSLTLELVRQLSLAQEPIFYKDGPQSALSPGQGCVAIDTSSALFSDDNQKVLASGIVLIDEIDVHLHPRWQRSIGPWFTKHFPNIQFIVTTHSPLVCQGAQPGTITRLPQPGIEHDQGERIFGVALDRLLYGDILDAVGSGAFGSGIERSDEGQKKLQRLALLNRKARRQGLDESETEERQNLRAIFGSDSD